MTGSSPEILLYSMLLCQGADLVLLLNHILSEPWSHPKQNLLLMSPSQVRAWSLLLFLPLYQPRALANLSVLRRVRNLSVLLLIRHEAWIRSKKQEFSRGVGCNASCSWPSEGWPSSIKRWLRLQNWDLSLGSDFIPRPSPKKQRMLELRVSSPGQVKPHIHPGG